MAPRLVLLSALACAFAAAPAGVSLAQEAPGHDPALAERVGADDRGMRRFVLVVLRTGPTPVTDADARKAMFAGHFANMERLSDEGKLALAGPFIEDADGWRGLFVMAVEDIDAARALVEADPVVASGEMVADYHPWYASAAVMLIPELHERLATPAE